MVDLSDPKNKFLTKQLPREQIYIRNDFTKKSFFDYILDRKDDSVSREEARSIFSVFLSEAAAMFVSGKSIKIKNFGVFEFVPPKTAIYYDNRLDEPEKRIIPIRKNIKFYVDTKIRDKFLSLFNIDEMKKA